MASSAGDFIGGGGSGISNNTTNTTSAHVNESPAPISTEQPAASNPAEDKTGGIPEGAGGVSTSANVQSPVSSEPEQKTVVGTVLETVFGKKERTAEESDALNTASGDTTAPTTTTSTAQETNNNNNTYLGAIAGAAAAGSAAVASVIPGMSSSKEGEDATAQQHSTGAENGTVGEKAAAAGDAVKDTANKAAESASETANQATDAAKDATGAGKSEEKKEEEGEEKEGGEKSDEAKKAEDHKAAVRENKDAIPVAGGERIGEAHEGESKIVPDNPKPADADAPETKPDDTTKNNTEKNKGADPAEGGAKKRHSILGGKKDQAESGNDKDKPKFMDRVKAKFSNIHKS